MVRYAMSFCFIGKRNLDEALARFEHGMIFKFNGIVFNWPYLKYDATIDAHQALANHKKYGLFTS